MVTSVGLLAFSAYGLPPAWYVPVNLVVTIGLLLVARWVGLTQGKLGLERDRVPAGLRWGAAAGLAMGVGLILGAVIPATRPLFDDARAAGIGPGLLAYRTLVRIPLGTALLEEVAFRGVLLGAWRRISTAGRAAVGSSLVFGLWHVRPALELLNENDAATDGPERILAVVGAVVATTVGGLALCWLRLRSESLAAPYLAHVAANSLATVGAYLV